MINNLLPLWLSPKYEPCFIEGFRVALTPMTLDSVEGAYQGWLNDQEVCKYNSHAVYSFTADDAKEWVDKVRKDPKILVLKILAAVGEEDKKELKHIGNVSLSKINIVDRSAEFGILIGDTTVYGKGYGTEAAFLICDHGFNRLNLNMIYLGTHEDNTGMHRIATSMGMVETGRRRQATYNNGKYADIVFYDVLKDEFNSAYHDYLNRKAEKQADNPSGSKTAL